MRLEVPPDVSFLLAWVPLGPVPDRVSLESFLEFVQLVRPLKVLDSIAEGWSMEVVVVGADAKALVRVTQNEERTEEGGHATSTTTEHLHERLVVGSFLCVDEHPGIGWEA